MAQVPSYMQPQGSYWVGTDGNVYYKADSDGSVTNKGTYLNGTDSVFSSDGVSMRARRIDDPNPQPVQQNNSSSIAGPAPTGGGGGGSSLPTLNTAAISNTQKTLDELPGLLSDALAAEETGYNNTRADYNTQEQQQQGTYDKSTVTNQKNYDGNFMDSIRAGVGGLRGLFQILRGTGAGGGTAEELARDTVGGVTAGDIRDGLDTREENQTQLDDSLGSFMSNLKRKRETLDDTFDNNKRAITRESNQQRQDLYGKIAGFYSDAERTGDATNWLNKAGKLTSAIARDSRTKVSKYDNSPVEVSAPKISAFDAPTQPSVQVATPQQVGSGIFTISDPERRREQEQAAYAGS